MLTLVTGATGHLGNVVVKKLLEQGRKVRVLARGPQRLEALKVHGELPAGLQVAFGDILDRGSLKQALEGVSRVFHLAAIFKTRGVDESMMIQTNVKGTENILECAAFAGSVEKIVYTSSVAAVGCLRHPGGIMDETVWNTDPIDAYVASKVESEHLARQLMHRLGLKMVFVNPATVLGPRDFGPTPSNEFVLMLMKKAPPVWFDSGHSYVDVEDVAEGHLLAEEKGRPGERYILSGENVSNLDLFRRVSELTGGRKPFFKVGHRFVEVVGWALETKARLLGGLPTFTRKKAHKLIDYYGYFDHAKASRELGFNPRPLAEILPRCRAWFMDRGWL